MPCFSHDPPTAPPKRKKGGHFSTQPSIMKKANYQWNGEPCNIQHLDILLDDPQIHNSHWYSVFAGEKRRVIEVNQRGQSFIIDNEDGLGIKKVLNGGGMNSGSRHYDKAQFKIIGPTPEDQQVLEFNLYKYKEIEFQSDAHIKLIDPEKHMKLAALKDAMNLPMNREQAIEAMMAGKRVTHRVYFIEGEWIEMKDGVIHDEDGNQLHEFWKGRTAAVWNRDWLVVPTPKQNV